MIHFRICLLTILALILAGIQCQRDRGEGKVPTHSDSDEEVDENMKRREKRNN